MALSSQSPEHQVHYYGIEETPKQLETLIAIAVSALTESGQNVQAPDQ